MVFHKVLVKDPLFGFVLRAAIETHDREAIEAIPMVIEQSRITAKILQNLTASGFIKHYRIVTMEFGRLNDFLFVIDNSSEFIDNFGCHQLPRFITSSIRYSCETCSI
jgi:hypothetical protein